MGDLYSLLQINLKWQGPTQIIDYHPRSLLHPDPTYGTWGSRKTSCNGQTREERRLNKWGQLVKALSTHMPKQDKNGFFAQNRHIQNQDGLKERHTNNLQVWIGHSITNWAWPCNSYNYVLKLPIFAFDLFRLLYNNLHWEILRFDE